MQSIVNIINKKKVHVTEAQTTLTAPKGHLKHCWLNVWLPSHRTNWRHCLVGLATLWPCGPFSPPPQSNREQQFLQFLVGACWTSTLNCIWTLEMHLEHGLFSFFHFPFFSFSRKRIYSAGLYCPLCPFGHLVTHCYSLTYEADEDLKYVTAFQISSLA